MLKKSLSGITIIDHSRLIPGPFCSLILADLGAQVIKLEDQSQPDYLSDIQPKLKNGEGALYAAFNRNKKIVRLDLKSKQARQKMLTLVKKADVFMESYRPGVAKQKQISYAHLKKINPHLIYASITGYGQKGSKAHLAGHDLNYLSQAAIVEDTKVQSVLWADLVGGGLWAAIAILAALLQRKTQKKAAYLDISMADSMIFMNMASLVLEQLGVSQTVLSGTLARYRVYETKDKRLVSLASLETKFWNRFCELIGQTSLQDGQKFYQDKNNVIHQELEKVFKSKTWKQWQRFSAQHDLCLTPVLSPQECLTSDFFKEHGFFVKKDIVFPTIPLK